MLNAENLVLCAGCGKLFDYRVRPDYSHLCVFCDLPEPELVDLVPASTLHKKAYKKICKQGFKIKLKKTAI